MSPQSKPEKNTSWSRRQFLQASVVSGAAAYGAITGPGAHAAGSDVIKVGLIGCGGRGSGAAANAMNAGKDVRLVAMADMFAERIKDSRPRLKKMYPEQVAVDDAHCFVGFDAYRKVIDSDVDVVVIAVHVALPPRVSEGRRRRRQARLLREAAGIDVPGVKMAMAACRRGQEEEPEPRLRPLLALRPGRPRDDQTRPRRPDRRDHRHPGELSPRAVRPPRAQAGVERNAVPVPELVSLQLALGRRSGAVADPQHRQASWALGDVPPLKAWGMGGRQVCVEPKYGDAFDHQAIVYEYANGVRIFGYCRDIPGCYNDISNVIFGTKGRAFCPASPTSKARNPGATKAPTPSMYDVEHKELFEAIRAGKTINNGTTCASARCWGSWPKWPATPARRSPGSSASSRSSTFALPRYGWDVEPPVKPGANGQYPTRHAGHHEAELSGDADGKRINVNFFNAQAAERTAVIASGSLPGGYFS